MPTYVYQNCDCKDSADGGTFELNVPIAERDNLKCLGCDKPLKRKIAFSGLTWAPTAGGMR